MNIILLIIIAAALAYSLGYRLGTRRGRLESRMKEYRHGYQAGYDRSRKDLNDMLRMDDTSLLERINEIRAAGDHRFVS